MTREAKALDVVRTKGGTVYFGAPEGTPHRCDSYHKRSRDRSFLARLVLGTRYSDRASLVHFHQDATVDDDVLVDLVPHLSSLGTIRAIQLEDTGISSEALVQLSKLKNLEVLNICITDVDDSATASIESLRCLQFLDVYGTRLSVEAIARIQSSLPNCRIRGPKTSVGYFADAD